ncbi:MAG: phosphoribosylformylglycinamidine synthase subunit PurQ [Firmicutes bacterium]|nr:phosphoribosylformylglycinamidine synthase subunit PurQ [Bacillota bacterium]
MKSGIVVFPGSNCDLDAYHLLRDVLNEEAEYIRHDAGSIGDVDLVILPGGFSYGDYLRSGAIARFSRIMPAVAEFAASGGLVLGICNGFQVLTEAGLLPGALIRNRHLQFRCSQVYLRVENTATPFTCAADRDNVLQIPIAHGDGSYYAPREILKDMEEKNQVLFRYVNSSGDITEEANPNGSIGNIAGVCNESGNVAGLMPHPERAGEKIMGSEDGLVIFRSLLQHLGKEGVGASV